MRKNNKNRGIVVKRGYYDTAWILWSVFLLVYFVVSYFQILKIRGFRYSHLLIFGGIVLFLFVMSIGTRRSIAMFIDDKAYCFYGFRKKVYDISSIVCVKCAVTYISSSHMMDPYVKKSDGTYAKTIFYLKEIKDGMERKENSYNFNSEFHRSILFSSVYDERVLQYLKIVNPNIVIMECED